MSAISYWKSAELKSQKEADGCIFDHSPFIETLINLVFKARQHHGCVLRCCVQTCTCWSSESLSSSSLFFWLPGWLRPLNSAIPVSFGHESVGGTYSVWCSGTKECSKWFGSLKTPVFCNMGGADVACSPLSQPSATSVLSLCGSVMEEEINVSLGLGDLWPKGSGRLSWAATSRTCTQKGNTVEYFKSRQAETHLMVVVVVHSLFSNTVMRAAKSYISISMYLIFCLWK